MMKPCLECGAPVPDDSSCRDHFHALLFLESQILRESQTPADPNGRGGMAHFQAVASYVLQHPDSMNVTAETLAGLRAALADALDGRAAVSDLRRRAGLAAEGPKRVTRRAGEVQVPWKRGSWPMTVADVITVEADEEAYAKRVSQWARSVLEALDRLHQEKPR